MTSTKQILKPLLLFLGVSWSCFLFAAPVTWHLSFIQVHEQGSYVSISGSGQFSYDSSKTCNSCYGWPLTSISINNADQHKFVPEKPLALSWWTTAPLTKNPQNPGYPPYEDQKWVFKSAHGTLTIREDANSPATNPGYDWVGSWAYDFNDGSKSGGKVIANIVTSDICHPPKLNPTFTIPREYWDGTLSNDRGYNFDIPEIQQ